MRQNRNRIALCLALLLVLGLLSGCGRSGGRGDAPSDALPDEAGSAQELPSERKSLF